MNVVDLLLILALEATGIIYLIYRAVRRSKQSY